MNTSFYIAFFGIESVCVAHVVLVNSAGLELTEIFLLLPPKCQG